MASMSRKHFEALAQTIREMDLPTTRKRALAETQADYLATTNPQFNRSRFIEAATRKP